MNERDRQSMAFRAAKRQPLWPDPTQLSRSERARAAAKEPVFEGRNRKRNALQRELVASKSANKILGSGQSHSTLNLHDFSANFQSEVPRFRSVGSVNDLFWRPSCQN